jgi:hypothetical protein
MTNEQKQRISISITVARDALQRMVDGEAETENLSQRRDRADWEVCWLFKKLIPVLPNNLQAGLQACYDLREQVWSDDYRDGYFAQQETSPSCLQASDSF